MLDTFIEKYRLPLLTILIGLVLLSAGFFLIKSDILQPNTKVEVLSNETTSTHSAKIVVEIGGEIEKPGVYEFPEGTRVDELLNQGGKLKPTADTAWVEKSINRAAKLTDGMKVYVPKRSTVSTANNFVPTQTTSASNESRGSGGVNINASSQSELEKLPGIGPTYAQKIIEHRPYSTTEEMVSKGAIKQKLFDSIKDQTSVY